MARDEYAVGLQLAALQQVIRLRDPNTARMVEFLLQAPGFVVEPRADLDLEPPLWAAVREQGVPLGKPGWCISCCRTERVRIARFRANATLSRKARVSLQMRP
jgi:hypothetical protein